ncbi:MAG: DNA polymerase Y family protein [Deltaproteobacteria bacterium]
MSWFLHIDMDAFFVSVERVLDPSLRGKPVIVGGRDGRGVVTSASYEAREFGVHSAMPGFKAKRLCPHGIFLPNRHGIYSEYSRKVFSILDRFSPEVHSVSIDEGVIDLTGTEKLFGPPLKTADLIIRQIEAELGLPSSAGLSTSRVTAKIAATVAKPRGLIYVPAGCETDFLAPLAVTLIPGVGAKTHRSLVQHGIHTIGEFLEHGEPAARFLDLSESDRKKRSHDHSIGNETTLAQPLSTRERMEEVLWELTEEVGGRLRRQNLYARCLTLKIRYTDFRTLNRSRTIGTPTCFDREIFAVVSALLQKNLAPGRAVRLLGVSASALQTDGWQDSLFGHIKGPSWEKLYRGIDDLRRKYGTETIGAATPRMRAG